MSESLDRALPSCVVYVSGCPGAGKSTLAEPLAALLGLPLVSKDAIKESLFDSIPPTQDLTARAWSQTLGAAAMELLWVFARQPVPVMIEANFRRRSLTERAALGGLGRPLVEVYCACPPDIAAARYAARAENAKARRGDVHVLTQLTPAMLAEFDGPMGLGELVEVDTSRPVDARAIAPLVRAAMVRAAKTATADSGQAAPLLTR